MCNDCADIGEPYTTGDNAHVWNGQLWLWLDWQKSRLFHVNVLKLVTSPLIEKVSVIYHVDGKEIVDIVFKGAGTGQLDESMTVITEFFSCK